jgi:hypothetical protein
MAGHTSLLPDHVSEGAEFRAPVDLGERVGVCSTRPSATGDTGVDTIRLLFETRDFGETRFEIGEWAAGSVPALGLTWVEGHPTPGGLAKPDQVRAAAMEVRAHVDELLGVGVDRGVSRLDVTTTRAFGREMEARAFLAGMATLQLPRCETTRRGDPVHSIAWTHATGRRKLARCYDKGLERGGSPFELVRLEDQRRFPAGSRPPIDVASDGDYQREKFVSRFGPMRKAVDGVRAASFPVIAQALADEVKYGYREVREAERLAGALVLLSGGAGEGYARRTMYRRRAELREAGYVIADSYLEPVEVDLGEVLEAALEEFGG